MAYITLNPIRAEVVDEPAEYRWCGYAERMAKGKVQDRELELANVVVNELELPENTLEGNEKLVMERIWDVFRESLLEHFVERKGIDR